MSSWPNLEESEAALKLLAESIFALSPQSFSPLFGEGFDGEQNTHGPDYEARYKALIEHIAAVIFVSPLEVGQGEAYVSPQVESILGFTQEEWLANPLRWYEQIHPGDKLRWSLEAAKLFRSGRPLNSNYRVLARDGRVVWFKFDARLVHSEGKPSFIHGVGFDITEMKEAEASLKRMHGQLEERVEERTRALALSNTQLKEEIAEHKRTEARLVAAKEAAEAAARTKSEFLANISHEIRTPMNGVLGMTNLVLDTNLDEEQREHLCVLKSSAESLLGIINQVLDFSKIEAGKSQLELERFNLRKSLESLAIEWRYQAEQKSLTLTTFIDPSVPEFFVGDIGRLRQILTNLAGNAIKFTHAGAVSLKVTSVEEAGTPTYPHRLLRFSINDTGIGIPADQIERIFQPFTQADGSITRQYGGTGLGLSISKALLELMGGRLQVQSEPSRGSTFSFTTPLEVAKHQAEDFAVGAAGVVYSGDVLPAKSRSLRILIVEDNLINQKVVSRIVEKQGHVVTVTTNGLEALKAFTSSSFDVALMDVQMPLMDGLSATAAIRTIETQQSSSRLPIIGLTAHALPADFARCVQAGMDGYLSKPFKANDLISLINQLTVGNSKRLFPWAVRKDAAGVLQSL